jgi:hypothetical protein
MGRTAERLRRRWKPGEGGVLWCFQWVFWWFSVVFSMVFQWFLNGFFNSVLMFVFHVKTLLGDSLPDVYCVFPASPSRTESSTGPTPSA